MRLVAAAKAESKARVVRLPSFEHTISRVPESVLCFDVETLAAGFADPDWVPQFITCVAWSWVGSEEVVSHMCGAEGFFKRTARAAMLKPLLDEMAKADVVMGHNILRFDLPVINAECLRFGFDPIREIKALDTMKLPRSKGFKKGLDNLGVLYGAEEPKQSLNWQEWWDAYEEDGWPTIQARAESDVRLNKEIAVELEARDLTTTRVWRA